MKRKNKGGREGRRQPGKRREHGGACRQQDAGAKKKDWSRESLRLAGITGKEADEIPAAQEARKKDKKK
jgi:hypothetical protein